MGELLSQAYRQAGQIRDFQSELSRATGEIDTFLQSLESRWDGPEMKYLRAAFVEVKEDIQKARNILSRVDDTLIQTARRIDEERKQALEAAEKAKRAKQN